MTKYKVLVCGGREFDDWNLLDSTLLSQLDGKDFSSVYIIEGEAKGADFLARVWAKYRGIPNKNVLRFYPDWKKYGYHAGHTRNQQMLDEGKPDLVIAFPGGTGTADMVRRSKEFGVKVLEVAKEY